MFENPSADKFEPPPEPSSPRAEAWNGTRIVIALLFLAISVGSHWLPFRGRGWITILSAVALFAVMVAEYVLQRKHAEQLNGQDPYTPPTHITR